ncbi:MAG: diguanylate cyclase [Rhodobacterales bacterium]|nr:diguanylate cyclase [Rhodobacterales bacterium]
MSGRIVIVDSIATNRIMLRATLKSAHHDVITCATLAEAEALLASGNTDVALFDLALNPNEALDFCQRVKADPATSPVRLIALATRIRPDRDEGAANPWRQNGSDRIAALRAGADDVLDKGISPDLLLASIRAALRARNKSRELAFRDGPERVHGFAEATEGFVRAARIALITARPDALHPAIVKVMSRQPGPSSIHGLGEVVTNTGNAPPVDLYIVDAVTPDGAACPDLVRSISDLRADATSRHAASLVILPKGADNDAAIALDLGANTQVTDEINVDELAHRVRSLIRRKQRDDRQRDNIRHELHEATIDSKTGLYNERHARRKLERMADHALTSGAGFGVMMLDIDHFKTINDTWGHPVGDRVLAEVARRLRDNLRAVDLVARVGGEEFLVVIPENTAENVLIAAERLRHVIDRAPFDASSASNRPGIPVTLSIGVAIIPGLAPGSPSSDQIVASMLVAADDALYKAKKTGRNRVVLATYVPVITAVQSGGG